MGGDHLQKPMDPLKPRLRKDGGVWRVYRGGIAWGWGFTPAQAWRDYQDRNGLGVDGWRKAL